jgi:hypothetical protein
MAEGKPARKAASKKKPKEEAVAEEAQGFRNRIVGLEMVPASEILEHPKNWRLHPPDQRSALSSLLETIGITDAVLAYRSERHGGKLTLIDGHLRKDLVGEQAVPVLVTDLNDAEADATLASHDVVTTMAVADEAVLQELLNDVEDVLPRDVLIAIDPGLGPQIADLTEEAASVDAKYPIVPQLDEGYDFVVIFCTREMEYSWLRTTLDLPKKLDRKRVGLSHVLTAQEFRDRWEAHGGRVAVNAAEEPVSAEDAALEQLVDEAD